MGLYVQKATSTTTSIDSFDPCDELQSQQSQHILYLSSRADG